MIKKKKKKRLERYIEGNIQSGLRFYLFIEDRCFLKTWISRRISYFVDILSAVGDVFLPSCPQVLFLLNVGFRGIFKPHKSLVQKGESSYR